MALQLVKNDKVKIKGTEYTGQVEHVYPGGTFINFVPDREADCHQQIIAYIPVTWLDVIEPYSWPPQVGDIWTAGGKEWFFRKSARSGNLPIAVREDGEEKFADGFKALNPVLVRRRGV